MENSIVGAGCTISSIILEPTIASIIQTKVIKITEMIYEIIYNMYIYYKYIMSADILNQGWNAREFMGEYSAYSMAKKYLIL